MNSSVILRSPNLAEGGDVRVVRLHEIQQHARGGLAHAMPAREVLMHVTPSEAAELEKQWGAPKRNASGHAEYAFQSGALKPVEHRADGGWLEGYGPTTKQPEPLKLTRTQTPLASAEDYYNYGAGPEHQFFNENVVPNQPKFPAQPTGAAPPSSSAGAGGGDIAGALGLALAAKQGWDSIKGSFDKGSPTGAGGAAPSGGGGTGGGGTKGLTEAGSLSNGVGMDDVGGALAGVQSLTSKEGKFKGTLSGASSGMSLGGWPGAIVGGALGYAQEGGVKDANPWDASGFSGTTMDKAWQDENIARLASNPAASVASKLGVKSDSALGKILDPSGLFSKHGDEKRNLKAFTSQYQLLEGPNGQIALPDGKVITKDQLQHLAGTWYGATYHPDGDQEGWQKKFQDAISQLYGYAQGGALRSLGEFDSESAQRHVRGPGTGRSDSIPAQLSDGEYVLTAEDVALLGDGSNEAGARKLDDFRHALRKHKGGALSRGKISPNAKAPMEYLGEARR